MGNIIGSDGSHARVDVETALVCDQRRRTGGATAVSGLDDDGWYSETCVVLIVGDLIFQAYGPSQNNQVTRRAI